MESGKYPDCSQKKRTVCTVRFSRNYGGAEGTRTLGLRRDRPALNYRSVVVDSTGLEPVTPAV